MQRRRKMVAALLLACLLFSGCGRIPTGEAAEMWSRTKRDGTWVYETDYIEEYRDVLDAMFDGEWTVVREEEAHHEPPRVCCHIDYTPMRYTEWTIAYTDANGDAREFVLNNTAPISEQVERYLVDGMMLYFKEEFYDRYLDGVPLEGPSYVFGFFERVSVNPHTDENRPRVEKIAAYKGGLNTPEGALCLSKVSPETVFAMCPFYLAISVSISDKGLFAEEKQAFEADVKERVVAMIGEMNAFTGHTLNASVDVDINRLGAKLYDGEAEWYWALVRGSEAPNVSGRDGDYERALYDAYVGTFWD